jgi:hypothetical protein
MSNYYAINNIGFSNNTEFIINDYSRIHSYHPIFSIEYFTFCSKNRLYGNIVHNPCEYESYFDYLRKTLQANYLQDCIFHPSYICDYLTAFICIMLFTENHTNLFVSNIDNLVFKHNNNVSIKKFKDSLCNSLKIIENEKNLVTPKLLSKEKILDLIIKKFIGKKRSTIYALLINLILLFKIKLNNFTYDNAEPFPELDIIMPIETLNNNSLNASLNKKAFSDKFTRITSTFFNSKVTKNDSENLKKEKETIAENKVNSLKTFVLNQMTDKDKDKLYKIYISMNKCNLMYLK